MFARIFVRSAYNYDTDKVSNETGLECKDESMAQQHQKEDADINTLVKRFRLTGEMPENVRIPQYGDFRGIKDYQSALEAVSTANEAFMELPAEVRARFENDPEQFVSFCLDERNKEEAIKIGLIKKEEPVVKGAVPATGTAGNEPASPAKG